MQRMNLNEFIFAIGNGRVKMTLKRPPASAYAAYVQQHFRFQFALRTMRFAEWQIESAQHLHLPLSPIVLANFVKCPAFSRSNKLAIPILWPCDNSSEYGGDKNAALFERGVSIF